MFRFQATTLNIDDEKSAFKLPDDFDEGIPFDLHFEPNKRIKLEISLEHSDGYFNIDNCRVIVQDMKDRPGPRTQPEYITSTTWGCTLPHCGYKTFLENGRVVKFTDVFDLTEERVNSVVTKATMIM